MGILKSLFWLALLLAIVAAVTCDPVPESKKEKTSPAQKLKAKTNSRVKRQFGYSGASANAQSSSFGSPYSPFGFSPFGGGGSFSAANAQAGSSAFGKR